MTSVFGNPFNRYMFLWLGYNLQGTLYESGSAISRVFLIVILLISIKEAATFYFSTDDKYFKSLNLLVALYTIYGLILFMTDGNAVHSHKGELLTMNYLKSSYMSLLPIYVSYLYTKKGYLTLRTLQLWMPFMFITAISEYYFVQQNALTMLANSVHGGDGITNDAGYVILSIIPGLLVYRNKPLIMYSGLALAILLIFIGMKRGAILISVIAMIIIIWHLLSKSKGNVRLYVIVTTTITFAVLLYFLDQFVENSEYFMLRMQATMDGDSSGRDEIYNNIWNSFSKDYDFLQQIFGRGAWASVKYSHNLAHNDWLETLANQGIFGVLLLVSYWFRFYKKTNDNSLNDMSRFSLKLIFCMYFIQTLMSMSICEMPIYATTILGFCLADGYVQTSNKFIV